MGHIPSRTLANANVRFSDAKHWDLNLWVKNLFDEEYVGGVLLLAEQTKFMVAHGAERSAGLSLRYDF